MLTLEISPAAGRLDPFAVSERTDNLGGDAIKESAVVADDQHRAVIAREHLLQRIERVHVEIVGRFVEHEQVGGLRERDGERQAIALAAGKRGDRLAKLLGGEQEFLGIGGHMARHAAHHDLIAAGRRQRVLQRDVRIDNVAALIDVSEREVLPQAHAAAVGLTPLQQQFKQCRLAAAIGADNADAIAAPNTQRKARDKRALPVAFGNVLGVDHEPRRFIAAIGDDGGAR